MALYTLEEFELSFKQSVQERFIVYRRGYEKLGLWVASVKLRN